MFSQMNTSSVGVNDGVSRPAGTACRRLHLVLLCFCLTISVSIFDVILTGSHCVIIAKLGHNNYKWI